MEDDRFPTHIITQLAYTQPCSRPHPNRSTTKPSSKSSRIDFVITSKEYESQSSKAGVKRPSPRPHPQKGYLSKARQVLLYGEPNPELRFVPSPRPANSTLPPPMTSEQRKAKAAIRRARLAAATAEIEARSARYLAAAPRIQLYCEDPSKKKASEAAATSTEGQAEAGGPVPKSTCEDPNPCAADLIRPTSTMSI